MTFDYNKHVILLALAGSRAYGINNESSDYDYRGVIIPPPHLARGFLHSFEQKEGLEGYGKDSTAYDIRKFCYLAMNCNPNIVETLFVDDSLVQINTKYGKELRKNKELFLSKRARRTFSGYAFAQLKRIKQHKAWWDKELSGEVPPKPSRAQLGLPAKAKYKKDVLNGLMSVPTEMLDPEKKEYILSERKYFLAKQKYDSWKTWRTERNPARYLLEKEFGYDLKAATHLVRLTVMCEEIATEGTVIVTRPDAEFLKNVRAGAWNYDGLIAWAEEKEAKLDKLYENSTLQDEPDKDKINQLCVDLVEQAEKDGFGK